MSKSDTVLKKQLDSIGDVGNLKRRRFIGGSTYDQKLWQDEGLTFGINKIPYGFCHGFWISHRHNKTILTISDYFHHTSAICRYNGES